VAVFSYQAERHPGRCASYGVSKLDQYGDDIWKMLSHGVAKAAIARMYKCSWQTVHTLPARSTEKGVRAVVWIMFTMNCYKFTNGLGYSSTACLCAHSAQPRP